MPPVNNRNTVLAIGGIDPSGGAGLFTDCAAIRSTGAHCAGVAAVITVQSGLEFKRAICQNTDHIKESVDVIKKSQNIVAIKTGALGSMETIDTVCDIISQLGVPAVIDPVLNSTTGGILMGSEQNSNNRSITDIIKNSLIKKSFLFTPNIIEAKQICGFNVCDLKSMEEAGHALIDLGASNVLIKGGHLNSEKKGGHLNNAEKGGHLNSGEIADILVLNDHEVSILTTEQLDITEIRGTGCALASLIAANIGHGKNIKNAILSARKNLLLAMKNSYTTLKGPLILGF